METPRDSMRCGIEGARRSASKALSRLRPVSELQNRSMTPVARGATKGDLMSTQKKSSLVTKAIEAVVAFKAGKGLAKAVLPAIAVSGLGRYLYRKFGASNAT